MLKNVCKTHGEITEIPSIFYFYAILNALIKVFKHLKISCVCCLCMDTYLLYYITVYIHPKSHLYMLILYVVKMIKKKFMHSEFSYTCCFNKHIYIKYISILILINICEIKYK